MYIVRDLEKNENENIPKKIWIILQNRLCEMLEIEKNEGLESSCLV